MSGQCSVYSVQILIAILKLENRAACPPSFLFASDFGRFECAHSPADGALLHNLLRYSTLGFRSAHLDLILVNDTSTYTLTLAKNITVRSFLSGNFVEFFLENGDR